MAEVGTRHRFVISYGHVQGDSIIMGLKKVRIKVSVLDTCRYCTCFQRDCHSLELFL
jgi:hypothetical protein